MVKKNSNTYQQQDNSALTSGISSGVAGGVMNAGGYTLTTCPSTDQSFYCKSVRWFNMFKMVLFIIFVIIMIYFLYTIFYSNKKRR
jgi:hypothetical protein